MKQLKSTGVFCLVICTDGRNFLTFDGIFQICQISLLRKDSVSLDHTVVVILNFETAFFFSPQQKKNRIEKSFRHRMSKSWLLDDKTHDR
jgi:hypothetical protein